MSEPDVVARAIRGLTYAVWSLCVLLLAMLSMPLWGSWMYRTDETAGTPGSGGMPSESSSIDTFRGEMEPDPDVDFSARPLKEKIHRASMIILTRRELEGDKHRAILSEILKQGPGVRFFYKVGDEYCIGCEGEGNLVFLTGNPAQMREAYSISDDRVGGLGDLTLGELRTLVLAEQSGP
jgi:hypothetical protein